MTDARLETDPDAQEREFEELGWVGVDRNAAEVRSLRQYLDANAGIRGLEVLEPGEIERAKKIFYRDGFVVVRDALTPDQLASCDRVIREMMSLDTRRVGNRGSHRYSFGGASLTGHQVHNPEWAMLIDLPTVTPILTAIFDSPDYICRGGGGDFCLPCPYVACNFLMVDFTPVNGPTRQIPGTQHSHEPMPGLAEEPAWMKLSAVCPAPAGSVLIRDPRAWHGGTPNLSDEVRAIPNAEYYAPWFREPMPVSMPREIFENLSEHGRRICRYIVAEPGQELVTGYRSRLGATPAAPTTRRSGVG